MSDLAFDFPYLLPLALILPVLAVVVLRHAYKQRRARLDRLGNLHVISRLMPPNVLAKPGWRMARLGAASALVGIAVSGPKWGDERSIVRSRGIDMILSLDASLSMLAQDEHPSRLEKMKAEVRRLRALSPGDRMAVTVFAGRSYVLSPFTQDEGALDLFLDNLDPSIVGQAGTALSRAIKQGLDLATISKGGSDRALVVMTDGEDWEPIEDVETEAKRAASLGISVVMVGFGTTQGTTIPLKTTDGSPTVKKDENGNTVITQYHPEYLKGAADAAGGTFIPAEATDKAARIKAALATLRTQTRASLGGETKTPQYQWFLFPAFLLLLLDTALIERRGRRPRRAASETAAVAAGLVIVTTLNGCVGLSRTKQGVDAYNRGQFAQAASLLRDAITAGDKTPETLYDFGTALVAADSMASAQDALGRLIDSKNDELRFRTLFNLGFSHLKPGLDAPVGQDNGQLDSALAVYKKAILMHPADLDAKWNYELALRKKKGGGGGGGGGGGASDKSPQGQSPQPQGGLGRQQAEQLLGSAAREERDVQAKKQKNNRSEPPPGGKDW